MLEIHLGSEIDITDEQRSDLPRRFEWLGLKP
jgi:hypothetical protein